MASSSCHTTEQWQKGFLLLPLLDGVAMEGLPPPAVARKGFLLLRSEVLLVAAYFAA